MRGVATTASPKLSKGDYHALRIALAVTASFVVAELLDWSFSFLGPVLAVQVLAGARGGLSWKELAAVPVLVLLSTGSALIVAAVLRGTPLIMLMVASVVLALSFYGHRRGAPPLATLLIQIGFAGVPVISVSSMDLAAEFVAMLIGGAILAACTAWIAYMMLPVPATELRQEAQPQAQVPAPESAAWLALLDSLILLPLLVLFTLGENTESIVMLMITISVLRAVTPGIERRVAVGLVMGNLIGGATAAAAYGFIALSNTFVSFVCVVLACCLFFGERIANGGAKAPLFAITLATFLIILGMAITPLPGTGTELFATRLFKVGLAALYVLGGLALLLPAKLRTVAG